MEQKELIEKEVETLAMGLYVSVDVYDDDNELSIYTHKPVNKKLFNDLCEIAKKYGYGFTLIEVMDDNVLTLRFVKKDD